MINIGYVYGEALFRLFGVMVLVMVAMVCVVFVIEVLVD